MIRALTLHQPWATLIALGVKQIETRSWLPPKALQGGFTLLVHAGKTVDDAACRQVPAIRGALDAAGIVEPSDLPTGAVVAVANVYRAARHPGGLGSETFREQEPFGSFGPERCYWFLSSTIDALPVPVPAVGHQGLWSPPPKLLDLVRAQVPTSVWLANEASAPSGQLRLEVAS